MHSTLGIWIHIQSKSIWIFFFPAPPSHFLQPFVFYQCFYADAMMMMTCYLNAHSLPLEFLFIFSLIKMVYSAKTYTKSNGKLENGKLIKFHAKTKGNNDIKICSMFLFVHDYTQRNKNDDNNKTEEEEKNEKKNVSYTPVTSKYFLVPWDKNDFAALLAGSTFLMKFHTSIYSKVPRGRHIRVHGMCVHTNT